VEGVGLLALAGGSIFSILGMLRSGPLDSITLPFSAMYQAAPAGHQMAAALWQRGPVQLQRDAGQALLERQLPDQSAGAHEWIRRNGRHRISRWMHRHQRRHGVLSVPAGAGSRGAMASIFALYALLLWSVRRLRPTVPLFSLLIFLRVSYVCVMSPFAPQAFTWTNVRLYRLVPFDAGFAAWLPERTPESGIRRAGICERGTAARHVFRHFQRVQKLWNKTKSI
jgi:hypothetical protein